MGEGVEPVTYIFGRKNGDLVLLFIINKPIALNFFIPELFRLCIFDLYINKLFVSVIFFMHDHIKYELRFFFDEICVTYIKLIKSWLKNVFAFF